MMRDEGRPLVQQREAAATDDPTRPGRCMTATGYEGRRLSALYPRLPSPRVTTIADTEKENSMPEYPTSNANYSGPYDHDFDHPACLHHPGAVVTPADSLVDNVAALRKLADVLLVSNFSASGASFADRILVSRRRK